MRKEILSELLDKNSNESVEIAGVAFVKGVV